MDFLERAPRYLFFTVKGRVGKTSLACASGVAPADRGQRVLIVSTDPASNLDAVLGIALGNDPRHVPGASGLSAMNIDPQEHAPRSSSTDRAEQGQSMVGKGPLRWLGAMVFCVDDGR